MYNLCELQNQLINIFETILYKAYHNHITYTKFIDRPKSKGQFAEEPKTKFIERPKPKDEKTKNLNRVTVWKIDKPIQ